MGGGDTGRALKLFSPAQSSMNGSFYTELNTSYPSETHQAKMRQFYLVLKEANNCGLDQFSSFHYLI